MVKNITNISKERDFANKRNEKKKLYGENR